ncbi:MAG TPA: hypothetical protein VGE72_11185 [Azospirillum sp.]
MLIHARGGLDRASVAVLAAVERVYDGAGGRRHDALRRSTLPAGSRLAVYNAMSGW